MDVATSPCRRPGDWSARQLEDVTRRGVGPVSDNGAPKVSVRVPDQLPTVIGNAMGLRGFDVAKQSLQCGLVMRLRSGREATQRPQRKRDIGPSADHEIHQRTDGGSEPGFCFCIRRIFIWAMIQNKLWIHRRRLRLTGLHAKVGEDLLDVLVLVDGHRPIGLEVKLDSEERTRRSQIVQSEFGFQRTLDLFNLILVCRRNEEVIDIYADYAIGFVEDAVARLRHGEAMGGQDAVDASYQIRGTCLSPYKERRSRHTYPGSSKPPSNSMWIDESTSPCKKAVTASN